MHYKQVNVLWGDENHRTICMVHADVTDILTAEQQAQKELEEALALAEEANQTKSKFLSSMSHDIRTPMNAIVNMTALGLYYIDDKERVEGCLKKIEISSQHLLSLVNDVLDMSRIERSGVVMNPGGSPSAGAFEADFRHHGAAGQGRRTQVQGAGGEH